MGDLFLCSPPLVGGGSGGGGMISFLIRERAGVRVKKVRGIFPLTSILSHEGRGRLRYWVFTGVAIFRRVFLIACSTII
jgi:hypothetical protein